MGQPIAVIGEPGEEVPEPSGDGASAGAGRPPSRKPRTRASRRAQRLQRRHRPRTPSAARARRPRRKPRSPSSRGPTRRRRSSLRRKSAAPRAMTRPRQGEPAGAAHREASATSICAASPGRARRPNRRRRTSSALPRRPHGGEAGAARTAAEAVQLTSIRRDDRAASHRGLAGAALRDPMSADMRRAIELRETLVELTAGGSAEADVLGHPDRSSAPWRSCATRT